MRAGEMQIQPATSKNLSAHWRDLADLVVSCIADVDSDAFGIDGHALGHLNVALLAGPSSAPAAPIDESPRLPAIIVSSPAGETFRTAVVLFASHITAAIRSDSNPKGVVKSRR